MRRLALLLAAGCAGAPPAPPPPPRPSAIPRLEGPSELARGPIATVRSRRFHFVLPLPDGQGFTIDEAPPSSFFRATHGATGSLLYVKKWRMASAPSLEDCRADLELTLPKPLSVDRRKGTPLEPRDLPGPTPFRSRVETWVRVEAAVPPDDPGGATGWLLAYGNHARECFGFAFATHASGAAGGSVVGDRLGAIAGSALARLRFEDPLGVPLEERDVPRVLP